MGLLYNASGDQPCYNATELVGPAGPDATWLFQWCTQRAGQELPYYPATGVADMFWDQGETAVHKHHTQKSYMMHRFLLIDDICVTQEFFHHPVRRDRDMSWDRGDAVQDVLRKCIHAMME